VLPAGVHAQAAGVREKEMAWECGCGKEYHYDSMEALIATEDSKGYRFDIPPNRNSPVAILAPHGGKIEEGTDQIAQQIAGTAYRLFCFIGHRKGGHNKHYLHVRSECYETDNARLKQDSCRDVIAMCDFVVAIHGATDREDRPLYLGGRDENLKAAIANELRLIQQDLKFKTIYIADDARNVHVSSGIEIVNRNESGYRKYAGYDKNNICNMGRSHKGAQLEISKSLRIQMVPEEKKNPSEPTPDLLTFVDAVKRALKSVAGSTG
jgi:phage replication-related protein YjqB (UPF0714/DUF867 family)